MLANITPQLALLTPDILIPENADLNSTTYSNIGVYSCTNNAATKTLTNCPTKQAFIMYVLYPLYKNVFVSAEQLGNGTEIIRILVDITPSIYIQKVQTRSTGTFAWNAWNKITTTVVS